VNAVKPAPLTTEGFKPVTKWFYRAIPAQSQGPYPRCESHATSNAVECLVREYCSDGDDPGGGFDAVPVGCQIDPNPLFADARAREYPYEPLDGGGLPLGASFRSAILLGLLPPSTQLVTVPLTPDALHQQLQVAPLVQGTIVHNGWADPKPNGMIPFSGYPSMDGGHATLIMSVESQAGGIFIPFQNQWVKAPGVPWGWNGYGILSWVDFALNTIQEPVSVAVTPAWIADLREWVRRPEWKAKWVTEKWLR
jgi:hypothetical protein